MLRSKFVRFCFLWILSHHYPGSMIALWRVVKYPPLVMRSWCLQRNTKRRCSAVYKSCKSQSQRSWVILRGTNTEQALRTFFGNKFMLCMMAWKDNDSSNRAFYTHTHARAHAPSRKIISRDPSKYELGHSRDIFQYISVVPLLLRYFLCVEMQLRLEVYRICRNSIGTSRIRFSSCLAESSSTQV